MKNLKNVEYTNYNDYLDGLIKSLSNFCNKSPLKPTIRVVREMNVIYVYYNNKELEIKINVNEDKKKVIGDLKKKLEKEYPIIYKKTSKVADANLVRKLLNEGKTLEEALNSTQIEYEPLYKIIRIHDRYNEIDAVSLSDDELYKFKCKIPIVAILTDLNSMGKDSEVLNNMTLLYKITKS